MTYEKAKKLKAGKSYVIFNRSKYLCVEIPVHYESIKLQNRQGNSVWVPRRCCKTVKSTDQSIYYRTTISAKSEDQRQDIYDLLKQLKQLTKKDSPTIIVEALTNLKKTYGNK